MSERINAQNRLDTHYVYLGWQYAGGPNECKHGIAGCIPCERCDRELVATPDTAEEKNHE